MRLPGAGRVAIPRGMYRSLAPQMHRSFDRIRTIFLAAFALCIAGVWALQVYYVQPRQRCEASHNWWDSRQRVCGHVVYIPDITHRPAGLKVD